MVFGYGFPELSDEQKTARRLQLDAHAYLAQLSFLAVLLLIFCYTRLAQFLDRLSDGKGRSAGPLPWIRHAKSSWAKAQWWMGDSVVEGWGTRGEWIWGTLWTLWTLYLCVRNTGVDYFHLTKRFGIVASAQLPFHYFLAMRSSYSPIQFLTSRSHEQLKSAHGVLGRILTGFFGLHAAFYLGYFASAGVLEEKLRRPIIILGLLSMFLFGVITSVSLGFIKRWSYRVFYFTHTILAILVLGMLIFHVKHIRLFVYETLAVSVLATCLRVMDIHNYTGQISIIPGTDLIKISIPLSSSKQEKLWKPGQHIYLSRPAGITTKESAVSSFIRRNHINPFSIASLPAKDSELLLIARTMQGSTKKMAALAKAIAASVGPGEALPNIPLTIEGPYGYSAHLPNFNSYAHVLLVSGGVGATFTVPLYRNLTELAPTGRKRPLVQLVWTVRNMSETSWAFSSQSGRENGNTSQRQDPDEAFRPGSVEVYVTRRSRASARILERPEAGHDEDDIEMAEADHLLSGDEDLEKSPPGVAIHEGRPSLSKIVDQCVSAYKEHEKVAVLVCGPKALEESTRAAVGKWIRQGRDVYYHAEAFAW